MKKYFCLLILVAISTNLHAQQTKKYNNKAVGFSFDYPAGVKLLKINEYSNDRSNYYIKVSIQNIGEKLHPGDFNKEQAMKTISELTSGKYGEEYDWALQSSKKVRSIGFLFAQDYMVTGRFDVCDVALERSVLFFFNNKQIVITSYGSVVKLRATMSEFFKKDKANCGDDLLWNMDRIDEFIYLLDKGKASKEIQDWYDGFDEIVESIIFAHR